MTKPKLVLLNDDGYHHINVFIHGYMLNKEDFFNFAAKVNTLELRGRTYFLFWGSESWSLPKPIPRIYKIAKHILKLKVVPSNILAHIPIVKHILKWKVGPPYMLADTAINAAYRIAHYLYYLNKAKNLGTKLKTYLGHVPNAKKYPIDLIGFSLGARVIHWALRENSWEDYNINDVVLLGGATDSNSGDWLDCLEEINGILYNIYSDRDSALLAMRLQLEYPIGKYPIPHRHSRLKNLKCKLGHKDYQDNWDWLLDQKLPNRKRSDSYYGWMLIECPWCEEEFFDTPYIKVQCQNCNLDFIYNHADDEIEYTSDCPEPIGIDCPYCGKYELPIQESSDYICIECEAIIPAVRKGYSITYKVDCEECETDGIVECDECKGYCVVYCDVCDGECEIPCGYCDGQGCGHCNDTGMRDCKVCESEGEVECDECEGKGEVECDECEGEGYSEWKN